MQNAKLQASESMCDRTLVPDTDASDVAILGAGVGGSMLAAILARHGLAYCWSKLKVILVRYWRIDNPGDGGTAAHHRRALSVPEIAHLATFQSMRHHLSSACGVKRGFTFIYHREGQPQRPEESTQFPTLAPPLGPDVHWRHKRYDQAAPAIRVIPMTQKSASVQAHAASASREESIAASQAAAPRSRLPNRHPCYRIVTSEVTRAGLGLRRQIGSRSAANNRSFTPPEAGRHGQER
jgi:glycine/D-amino acid oxidase-like deaminating enzyme